jgi:hypothetical protein
MQAAMYVPVAVDPCLCLLQCSDGDHVRRFKPGGIVTRVANQNNIDGHSGDAPQLALQSRLNLLSGMCMAFSPDQKYLYVTDMGNRRLRRIYCPNNV